MRDVCEAEPEQQPVHVVAGGGAVGFECARRLGRRGTLLLVDHNADRFAAAVRRLSAEGRVVERRVQRLPLTASAATTLADRLRGRPLGGLVHDVTPPPFVTTGRALFESVVRSSQLLLDAFSPVARAGSVAVCVCPHGTYEAIDVAAAELLDELERPRLFETLLERTDGAIARPEVAQRYAHEAVVRLCRRTAPRWSEVGARVVSVTVGPLDTVQGRMRLRDDAALAESVRSAGLRRPGSPCEVAAAVDWLTSPAAASVTGTALVVDGGLSAAAERLTAAAPASPG